MTAGREFIKGIRDITPILLGVAPFGMIYGVLAVGAGLPIDAAQAMSTIVFAGSAQFVAAQLFRAGTPGIVIIITTIIINLRHLLYSAAVAPYIKHLPWRWKGILAFMLTDEAFAIVITHYQQPGGTEEEKPYRRWYFLGAEVLLYICWQISTAAGILLGAQIPSSWELDFTLALTFIALVVPTLKNRAQIAAAATAGLVATAAGEWPYKLGLMAAAACGIAMGLGAESLLQNKPAMEFDGKPMNNWIVIIGMGVVTFVIRLSFIALMGKYKVPPLIIRGLNYVPSAVLSAIILPELLRPNNSLNISTGNYRMLAGVLAALVAWKSKNVLLTIAIGMTSLWLMRLLA